MTVELIRHGETVWLQERRYQGRGSDVPLSPEGRDALGPAAEPVSPVFTSGMIRCAETAGILFPGAEQIPVPGLAEMDFGAFEGHNFSQLQEDEGYRSWVEGNCEGRCPGGESRREFRVRVCDAFLTVMDAARTAGLERVVIVAHAGTQMGVLERFALPRRGYFDWQTACGQGLLLDAGRWPTEHLLVLREQTDYRRPVTAPGRKGRPWE